MSLDEPTTATIIGAVQDVSGTSISAILSSDQSSGLSFVRGEGYRVGQIGSFVRIPIGYLNLFGIVSQVGASAIPEVLLKNAEILEKSKWMTIQLIGEGYRSGKFQRGISQYPTINDEIHLVSEADLRMIYGKYEEQNQLVKIGHIAGSESIDALVDINKLITRHSAIVGSTGSGKSTTVAGLLNALSNQERFPSARIIVLDIHGEYSKALKDRANIFKISPNMANPHEHKLCIPYWALNFDDLIKVSFGQLQADGRAKNFILEKVIQAKQDTLKKYPIEGITETLITADSPIPFSLNKIWHDLYCTEFGTYYSNQGSSIDSKTWAYELDENLQPLKGNAMTGEPPKFKKVKNNKDDNEKINYIPESLNVRSNVDSLGAKLRVSRYDFLFKAADWHPDLDGKIKSSLANLIKSWIGNDLPITILDLSGVPQSLTNDIIGNILQVLYDGLFWARNLSEGGREQPLLIVMEEAHTYLNEGSQNNALTITKKIVKEGRKYGIGSMIVSQRPSEIDSTILSQCGTFFAMRLSNSADRSHIKAALSDNLDSLTSMLPILRTGEAIVIGEAVSLPMRTSIQAPPADRRPDSQDPIVCDVISRDKSTNPGGWSNPRLKSADYSDFVTTWLQQDPVLKNKLRRNKL